jgi:hypothetical protein
MHEIGRGREGEREIVRIPLRSQKELSCTVCTLGLTGLDLPGLHWTGLDWTRNDDDDDGK